ncbi:MAG TPA: Gfo/Idh/MocA family oxidoreductase [Phycisphaerae bacterium]|nr:Gfo/Idh/MocA family oxidoreductase [Phycisphaerae bacterium]
MAFGVGILGFAHPHVEAYCRRWRDDPDLGVAVAAGWDHDAGRLAAAAERAGCEAVADVAALLARPDVQGVVIAAETSLHADLAVQAARAGKAIVLQKPIALTLEQADEIAAAVESAGVPFTVAWQMRVDPQNRKMKELVESGALGRMCMFRRRHGLATHTWEGFDTSWHVDPECNRDIWADDAAHPCDLLYWMFGMPASVTAELGSLVSPKIPNDNGVAVFRYADGMIATISCSFTCVAGENTTEIIGTDGVVIQNFGDAPSCNAPRPPEAVALKWYLRGRGQWECSDLASPPNHGERIAALAGPLAEFFTGRRGPIATAREGRDVLRMVLACYDSNGQGQRVFFE